MGDGNSLVIDSFENITLLLDTQYSHVNTRATSHTAQYNTTLQSIARRPKLHPSHI